MKRVLRIAFGTVGIVVGDNMKTQVFLYQTKTDVTLDLWDPQNWFTYQNL